MKLHNRQKNQREISGRIRVAIWGMVGIAGLWVAVTSPISPLAMGRADALLGKGEVSSAATLYDSISLVGLSRGDREAALERAALIYTVELNDPDSARWRLDRLARSTKSAEVRARALEGIGTILQNHERNPSRAGRLLMRSYSADPGGERAMERLALAGRAFMEAHEAKRSLAVWRQLRDLSPQHAELAQLSMAEVYLSLGQVESAFPLYKSVAADDKSSLQWVKLARFGVITCLERMGDLDGAIAELDQVDLPDEIVDARVEAMLSRSDERLR